ncbi:MAG: sulfatase-like hydrolase/transferase [Bauldia litoralis]
MTDSRPNFILFVTDQQRADHLGCYGNPVLKTPNIDGLAGRGTRFDKFYVAAPVCQPNRATMMTGRMPTLHGVRQNGIALGLDATCYTHLLQAAGYRTGLFGKAHLQNYTGQPAGFPATFPDGYTPPLAELSEAVAGARVGPMYDRELTSGASGDPAADEALGPFYGFERFRICTWHGDGVGGHYTGWLNERLPDADKLRSKTNPRPDPRYDAPQTRWSRIPEELYPTSYVADMTIDFLRERAAGDAPFFVQCSFPDPHHPFTPPGKYWDMYDPADITLPRSFHERAKDAPPPLTYLHDVFARGEADRRWVVPYAVTEAEARQITAVTYGMLSLVDDAVGRVLATLDELGMAENTVILFTSDHGDWMGDHGIMQKGPLHYQGLVRVPFIWTEPAGQGEAAAATTDGLAGTLDMARSILMRAGLAPPIGMQGQNLNDMISGEAGSRHDGVVIEQQTTMPYLGLDRAVRVRTFVDAEWRLTLWEGYDWGELYNLREDPDELVNLWSDPGHLAARRALMERMLRKMIDLQDLSPSQVSVG